jgi:WD40 repeat protein
MELFKMWNFSNGHHLKSYEPTSEDMKSKSLEVTDICFASKNLMNDQLKISGATKEKSGYIVSVGWNKKVFIYPDDKDEKVHIVNERIVFPPSLQSMKHKDDIMSVTYSYTDDLIFTGSHDGSVIAWHLEGKRGKYEMHLDDDTCLSDNPARDAKSVDCLLVFEEQSTLLSGSADQWVRFWNNKNGKLRNKFKVKHAPDDALTAMATNKACDVLFTADTSG